MTSGTPAVVDQLTDGQHPDGLNQHGAGCGGRDEDPGVPPGSGSRDPPFPAFSALSFATSLDGRHFLAPFPLLLLSQLGTIIHEQEIKVVSGSSCMLGIIWYSI